MKTNLHAVHGNGLWLRHRLPIEVRSSLTDAELEVARMLADSYSNAAIAKTRGTAINTAANQVAAVYRKLQVRCRRECILRLYGGRLVPIDRHALQAVNRLAG
jgi:DNA-binding CsgD family transcriptional regulator